LLDDMMHLMTYILPFSRTGDPIPNQDVNHLLYMEWAAQERQRCVLNLPRCIANSKISSLIATILSNDY
jgi:hypothetical protein